jgi:general stress protein 26
LPLNGARTFFPATIWCAVNRPGAYIRQRFLPTARRRRAAQNRRMQQGARNDPAPAGHVWELVEKIRTAMLVTRAGEILDARPLQAYPEAAAGEIAFMTDSRRVISEVGADGRVLLVFSDKSGNNYVSLTGKAVVSNDRERIRRLWTLWALAYWKSADDPAIRLIVVTPEEARYWDAPGAVVATVAMLAGALSGKQPELGESGEVRL